MPEFKLSDILEATGGKFLQGDEGAKFSGISTDSRTIKRGELFIALEGQNFDGHNFVSEAIHKGAGGAIISRDIQLNEGLDFAIVHVEDTLASLRDMAFFHRSRFNLPIIAITGSNGKTTTKEMIYDVLSSEYSTLKTNFNYNNQIGISFTLLGLDSSFDLAVMELGINHFGEMEVLRRISQPSIAVFTNIGSTHLEFFDTPENVLKEKLKLIENFSDVNTVIINADDSLLREEFLQQKKNFRTFSFGIKERSDFQAKILDIDNGGIYFVVNGVHLFLPVLGIQNVYNALAAIAVGLLFSIPLEKISLVLRDFRPPPMRMNVEKLDDFILIDDTYNSNPESLRHAIETLTSFKNRGRKILVCADMLELGKHSENLHLQIGEFLIQSPIDTLLTIGKYAEKISDKVIASNSRIENVEHFLSSQEALVFLNDIIRLDDVILVKGSRAMHMEEITKALRQSRKNKITPLESPAPVET